MIFPTFRGLIGYAVVGVVIAGAVAEYDAIMPRDMAISMPHVVDGNTLRDDDTNTRYRLLGIDTPEMDQMCIDGRNREVPCGSMARDELVELIGGRDVQCRITGVDLFRRSLARCSTAEGDLTRAMLIRDQGVVRGASPIDHLHELAARIRGRGIWSTAFLDPSEYRIHRRAAR